MASLSVRMRGVVMDLPPAAIVSFKERYNFPEQDRDILKYTGAFNATIFKPSPLNSDRSRVCILITDADNPYHVSSPVYAPEVFNLGQ